MRCLIFLALIASGCSPHAGNQLVDELVGREDPQSECIEVTETAYVLKPKADGSTSLLLTADDILDAEAREVARSISIDRQDAKASKVRTFGDAVDGYCLMQVSGPTIYKNHAFLTYSAPGRDIGDYVFSKVGSKWTFV